MGSRTIHYVTLILWIFTTISCQETPFLQNLDRLCLGCLCYTATLCDLTLGCNEGYCGPYKISKLYWKDGGQITLPDDDRERDGAYQDCAISFQCAQKIIKNYLIKYARDCNDDGVTDCDDFIMIHFNGGYQCHHPLNRSEEGRRWIQRYNTCKPLLTVP